MIVDLFLRTHPPDFKWLRFLMRSLEKYTRGWRDLVIVFPVPPQERYEEDHGAAIHAALEKSLGGSLKELADQLREAGTLTGKIQIFGVAKEFSDDYIGQCVTKLRAWEFSNADEIAFLDSDLVLIREWTPDSLRGIASGNLRIEARSWDQSGQAKEAWKDITAALLGREPPFETMCRHPFQYPAQFLRRAWDHLDKSVLRSGKKISEFNYLGNYAVLFEPDRFNVGQQMELGDRDLVKQFWSWGGITFAVEDDLRQLGYWQEGDKNDENGNGPGNTIPRIC